MIYALTLVVLLAVATPVWAFPTVSARNGGGDSSAGTSTTVTLAGTASGDLLLVYIACRDATNVIDWTGTGFTQLVQDLSVDTANTGNVAAWAYKVADGTETTISVGHSGGGNDGCAWATWQIDGQHASTVPEVSSQSLANGTTPDPPSLNPSNWDTEETLWLTAMAATGSVTISDYPDNFVQTNRYVTSVTSNVTIGVGERSEEASSQDPNTFTISASTALQASTLGIRPAEATGAICGPIGGGISCGGMLQ